MKIDITNEWKEVSAELVGKHTGDSFVMLQSGNFAGTIDIKV